MIKYKITGLVQTLDKKKHDDLLVFTQIGANKLSKNQREVLRALLESVSGKYPHDEERFWSEYGSGAKQLRGDLVKSVESFFAFQQLDNHKVLQKNLYARYCMQEKISSEIASSLSSLEKELEQGEYWSPTDEIYEVWRAELELYHLPDRRLYLEKLTQLSNAIELFYQINRMRTWVSKMGFGKAYPTEAIDIELIKAEAEAVYEQFRGEGIIEIYYLVINLYYAPKRESYQELKSTFEDLILPDKKLSVSFKREIIEMLLLYCISQINRNQQQYALDYLDYMELLEELGELLNGGQLRFQRLKNGFISGLIKGDLSWFNRVTNQYARFMEDYDQEENPKLSLLMASKELYYWDGDVDKAEDALSRFETSEHYRKNPEFKISCDKMRLKYFFQKGDLKNFRTYIGKCREYIKQNSKLSEELKNRQRKTLNYFNKHVEGSVMIIREEARELMLMDQLWLERLKKLGLAIVEEKVK